MSDKIKYFAYVRKSTTGDERQALSIPAQMDKLTEFFGDLDIEFVEDKASAFKPFNRPNFARMLERIKKGERTGLLAWHPDRLSRNEKDAGEITYMIRTNVIADVKLATYHFENTPEGIWMLQMALSQSQYDSAKKGRDVKRGLEKIAKMGIQTGQAPIAYKNNKYAERGTKRLLVDEERFPLIRKAVDLMLTAQYSVDQVLSALNDEWGFRTLKGKKICRTTLYNIFTRPFYYGEFEYPRGSGNWHQGSHTPLMTREEFERIQFILGRPSQVRQKVHDFAYRGPMRCGECEAMITTEKKFKKLAGGGVAEYIYYHCTKRKNPNCSQGSIEESHLEKQIADELDKLEIPADFGVWALKYLRDMNGKEIADREKIYGNQRRDYDASVRRIDALIDMRANGEIDEEEFKGRKAAALEEKKRCASLLDDTDKRVENWLDVAERGFNYAEKAVKAFEIARKTKDLTLKKEIFTALGSNYTLKDGKLTVTLDNLLLPIKNAANEVRDIRARLELPKDGALTTNFGDSYSKSSTLLGRTLAGCSVKVGI